MKSRLVRNAFIKSKTSWVLAPNNYIPKSVLEEFKEDFRLGIRLTLVNSERQLLLEALNSNESYDVIFIDSANSRFLVNTENLYEADEKSIPNLKNVSADFLDIGVAGQNYLIPYSWQIIGWSVLKDKLSSLQNLFLMYLKIKHGKAKSHYSPRTSICIPL
ncbi:MAG: hypothetical protein R2827_02045 [Bdellovibrionales bacterium]